LLLALPAGCQDQSALPFGASDSNDPQSIAARILFSDPCQDFPNEQAVIRDMVRAVNAERAKQKLPPLKANDTLMQLADFYACRLVEGDFFDHIDPVYRSTLESRAADFGYAFIKIGENLAAGQTSVDQAVAMWMESPSHRAVLLDSSFTEIGVAVKNGGKSGPDWVQELGRPVTAGEEGTSAASGLTTTAASEAAAKPSQAPPR
jgi:uncharacterized protein YkwD